MRSPHFRGSGGGGSSDDDRNETQPHRTRGGQADEQDTEQQNTQPSDPSRTRGGSPEQAAPANQAPSEQKRLSDTFEEFRRSSDRSVEETKAREQQPAESGGEAMRRDEVAPGAPGTAGVAGAGDPTRTRAPGAQRRPQERFGGGSPGEQGARRLQRGVAGEFDAVASDVGDAAGWLVDKGGARTSGADRIDETVTTGSRRVLSAANPGNYLVGGIEAAETAGAVAGDEATAKEVGRVGLDVAQGVGDRYTQTPAEVGDTNRQENRKQIDVPRGALATPGTGGDMGDSSSVEVEQFDKDFKLQNVEELTGEVVGTAVTFGVANAAVSNAGKVSPTAGKVARATADPIRSSKRSMSRFLDDDRARASLTGPRGRREADTVEIDDVSGKDIEQQLREQHRTQSKGISDFGRQRSDVARRNRRRFELGEGTGPDIDPLPSNRPSGTTSVEAKMHGVDKAASGVLTAGAQSRIEAAQSSSLRQRKLDRLSEDFAAGSLDQEVGGGMSVARKQRATTRTIDDEMDDTFAGIDDKAGITPRHDTTTRPDTTLTPDTTLRQDFDITPDTTPNITPNITPDRPHRQPTPDRTPDPFPDPDRPITPPEVGLDLGDKKKKRRRGDDLARTEGAWTNPIVGPGELDESLDLALGGIDDDVDLGGGLL